MRVDGQQAATRGGGGGGGVVGDPEGRSADGETGGAEATSRKVRTVVYEDDNDELEESNSRPSTTRRSYAAVYTSPPAESPQVSSHTHTHLSLIHI